MAIIIIFFINYVQYIIPVVADCADFVLSLDETVVASAVSFCFECESTGAFWF